MATLHYRISSLGDHWLVSCEDVAIQDCSNKRQALDVAAALMNAARARGDRPVLSVRETRPGKEAA